MDAKKPNPKPRPDKQKVRDWLTHTISNHEPPPDIHDIRRELGWEFIPEPKLDDEGR